MSILIVEDEMELREYYKKVLILKGFKVFAVARNGQEAVELFKTSMDEIDLILMDYLMPVKNGIEATKEIIEIDKNAKIIFISAEESIKKESLTLGVIGFIEKPCSIDTFLEKINRAMQVIKKQRSKKQ